MKKILLGLSRIIVVLATTAGVLSIAGGFFNMSILPTVVLTVVCFAAIIIVSYVKEEE